MSLHVYDNLEQGSEAWLAARLGMVTASTVGKLLTETGRPANNETSRRHTLTLFAERITGEIEAVWVNDDMLRGQLDEPIARDMYAEHFADEAVTEVGFMTEDRWGFTIGASPDGLVGDKGGLEIKCPRAKGHLATIVADQVPAQYMAQIQCSLLVSGREYWDFVSYFGGLKPFVKRVYADESWANSILDAVAAFEQRVEEMTHLYYERTHSYPDTERRIPIDEIRVS